MSKETYYSLERDQLLTFENTCHGVGDLHRHRYQKRPITVSKETYYKRDVKRDHGVGDLHRHRSALRARLAGGEGWRVVRGLRAKGESQSPKIGACEQDSLAGWYLFVESRGGGYMHHELILNSRTL
jgi:hypothetical protein